MERFLGFLFEADTCRNVERFTELFERIYQATDAAFKMAAQGWLTKIRYSDSGLDRMGTRVWGVCDTEHRDVMFSADAFGLSEEFAGHLIAHELAHVKQAAAGLVTQQVPSEQVERLKAMWIRQRLESEADQFAAACGYPRTTDITLQLQGLPVDKHFSALSRRWKYLSDEQRAAFARRACDIRADDLSKRFET